MPPTISYWDFAALQEDVRNLGQKLRSKEQEVLNLSGEVSTLRHELSQMRQEMQSQLEELASKIPPDPTEVLREDVKNFLRDHPSGGSLHIVLEDWNLADCYISFCIDFAKERGDHRAEDLCRRLLRVPEAERESLLKFS